MGIPILGELENKTSDGVLADAKQIRNGYIVVKSINERDALKQTVLTKGAPVYVSRTGQTFRWNGSGWDEEEQSQSGGTSVTVVEQNLSAIFNVTPSNNADNTITLGSIPSGTTKIDWGDGAVTNIQWENGSVVDLENVKTHTYTDPTPEMPLKIYGAKVIDNEMFKNNEALITADIRENITYIGERAFFGCENLGSVAMHNSNIIAIGNQAFSNCTNLHSVIFSPYTQNIGSIAFAGCNYLLSIELPQALMGIAASAFQGCQSLQSLTITERVSYIEGNILNGCTALTTVIMKSITPPTFEANVFNGASALQKIIIPNADYLDAYKIALPNYADKVVAYVDSSSESENYLTKEEASKTYATQEQLDQVIAGEGVDLSTYAKTEDLKNGKVIVSTAEYATAADEDGNGNIIHDTYATKTALADVIYIYDGRISDTLARVITVENSVSVMNTSVQNIKNSINSINGDLQNLHSTDQEVQNKVDSNTEAISILNDRIREIEENGGQKVGKVRVQYTKSMEGMDGTLYIFAEFISFNYSKDMDKSVLCHQLAYNTAVFSNGYCCISADNDVMYLPLIKVLGKSEAPYMTLHFAYASYGELITNGTAENPPYIIVDSNDTNLTFAN